MKSHLRVRPLRSGGCREPHCPQRALRCEQRP
jgi:hypothetical protein